jgi:hypothetical protein
MNQSVTNVQRDNNSVVYYFECIRWLHYVGDGSSESIAHYPWYLETVFQLIFYVESNLIRG